MEKLICVHGNVDGRHDKTEIEEGKQSRGI